MQYSKEIILSDVVSQGISQAMTKQASVNMQPNNLKKNFSDWSKNSQPLTAEAIINDSVNSGRGSGGMIKMSVGQSKSDSAPI